MENQIELIEIVGKITYLLLWLTTLLGLGLWKFRMRWIRPWYHFLAAGLTLFFATAHLILVALSD